MGYHTKEIEKGKIGQFSKIKEEFEELEDAFNQNDTILMLVEMTDLYGAMEEYIKRWNLDMSQLKEFSDKTKSAFRDGTRE